jgi:hypothetical protein
MALLLWPLLELQDNVNDQQPAVGTSVMLGPPATMTTSCD